MSDPITLSAEAWVAIAAIATPLVAALASNIKLTVAVKVLTEEMKEVKQAVSNLPNHEGRILRLESAAARRQRK